MKIHPELSEIPSHEGYQNTIKLPDGSNVVPLRSDTLRLLKVQIFYDHVNSATRQAIDHSAGGKLCDKSVEESWELIENLVIYDHESWNDPRDLAKPVKAISVAHNVPSTSDRRLIELENQVQRLMEAHLNLKPSVQVNKISSSCRNTKIKEPERALEDEFKDLHLKLSVLEVLAHAPMYNAILDKYMESLELGKNRLGDSKPFATLADLGSCVNLIPLYLFETLNVGILEETENVLGLVDGTRLYLIGIVKNVEVILDEKSPKSLKILTWTILG
nr:MAK10-like protein [Tanacetum cinerariifolium]